MVCIMCMLLSFQLLEYNDTDDLANIEKVSKKTPWIVHDLKSVPWMSVTEAGDLEKNQVVFKVNQEFPSMSFKDNGSLAIQVGSKARKVVILAAMPMSKAHNLIPVSLR